jgi:hypothetical protein
MTKYRIAIFAQNEYRAYLNEAGEKRARNSSLNGTWTLEELRDKNAAFRRLPEGPLKRMDVISLGHPHQGLYAVVQEVIGDE